VRGAHALIIERSAADEPIVRISAVSRGVYTAAFRNHRGRWEPLPLHGELAAVVEEIIDMLAPFLEPDPGTKPVDTSGTDH
jgi:hypothetical protein